jgi:hypothetical protein
MQYQRSSIDTPIRIAETVADHHRGDLAVIALAQ